jgi:arylsulfatase A-like enzyme
VGSLSKFRRPFGRQNEAGRGVFAAACLVSFLLAGCGSEPEAERASPGPAHILLITLDTTRWDRMGFAGYRAGGEEGISPTPELDRIAEEATVFPEAFAAVPLTLPSHVSILTGLEPIQHGVRENSGFALVPKEQRRFDTLPELLRDAGYETAAFLSGATLDARFGLNAGFEAYRDLSEAEERGGAALEDRDALATTELALEWWKAKPKRSFCWVHYFDPHQPFVHHGRMSDELLQAGATLYEGEIAFMDAQIGRLREAWKEVWDETLVIVVADHGEGLGDHDEETHGLLVHDATTRVPLLVKYPRSQKAPRARTASTLDLFPTVTQLCSLASRQDQALRGRAFALAPEPRDHYAESIYSWRQFGWAPLRSLRRGDYKLVVEGAARRLFHWREDPAELRDLAAEMPTKVAELEAALRELRREATGLAGDSRRAEGVHHSHGGGYFGSVDVDLPVEPAPREEAGLALPSERMALYRALDRLRLQLDRMRSRQGGEQVAAFIDAAAMLEFVEKRARPDNPAARFWIGRARLLLATFAGDGAWPRDFRVTALAQAVRDFERYQKLRRGDARAFDQANLARIESYELKADPALLAAIERSVQTQIGLGLDGALAYALRARARFAQGGRDEEAREDARRAVERDDRPAFRALLER